MRLGGLDRLSYWFDETFSVVYARQPVAALLGPNVEQAHHPPLYYLLLHYWMAAGGEGEAWTRLLSALAGILTIPVLYYMGRALGGHRVGLLAAWLLALLPWHVWYSQETRMFSLVCLLGTAAVALAGAWRRRPTWLLAGAYVVVTAAGLYTEYAMFFLWPLLSLLVLVGGLPTRRVLAAWLALQGAVILAYLPQWGYALAFVGVYLDPRHAQSRYGIDPALWGLLEIGGGLVALALLGGLAWVARPRWAALRPRLPLLGGLILAGGLGLMLIPSGLAVKRALLVAAPLICLAGAWAIVETRRPARWQAAALGLAVLGCAVTVIGQPKQDWRALLAQIDTQARPGDVIILTPAWYREAVIYYDRAHLPLVPLNPPDLKPALSTRLRAYPRAWVIVGDADPPALYATVPAWFADHYTSQGTWQYYQIRLHLYGRGP